MTANIDLVQNWQRKNGVRKKTKWWQKSVENYRFDRTFWVGVLITVLRKLSQSQTKQLALPDHAVVSFRVLSNAPFSAVSERLRVRRWPRFSTTQKATTIAVTLVSFKRRNSLCISEDRETNATFAIVSELDCGRVTHKMWLEDEFHIAASWEIENCRCSRTSLKLGRS